MNILNLLVIWWRKINTLARYRRIGWKRGKWQSIDDLMLCERMQEIQSSTVYQDNETVTQ